MLHLHFPIMLSRRKRDDGDGKEEENLYGIYLMIIFYRMLENINIEFDRNAERQNGMARRRADVFTHNRDNDDDDDEEIYKFSVEIITLCKQFCVTAQTTTTEWLRNLQSIIPPVWLMLFNIPC